MTDVHGTAAAARGIPLVAWLALCLGCGAASGPISARTDNRDDAILLRFAPPVGLRYVTEISLSMDIGLGPTASRAGVSSRVVERTGGVTTLESVRLAAEATVRGETVPLSLRPDEPPTIERFDELARRLDDGEETFPTAAPTLFSYPEAPLRVGDRWTTALGRGSLGRHLLPPIEIVLVAVEGSDDGRMARLHGEVVLRGDGSNAEGGVMTMDAEVHVATGVIRDYRLQLVADAPVPGAAGNAPATLRMGVHLRTTFTPP